MALGAVVALVADSLAWFAIGTALGLAIAGVTLRDSNAARELSAGRAP